MPRAKIGPELALRADPGGCAGPLGGRGGLRVGRHDGVVAVVEKLKALYPDDKAVGYRPGEIRGAMTIRKPV